MEIVEILEMLDRTWIAQNTGEVDDSTIAEGME